MSLCYYDLNSKTRVCSCHRHPGCKTIPEENKEEAELIWSLVNYDAGRKSKIKATLTKWLTSVNHPGINLMYKKDKRILELEGGTIIHLIYILDNDCILLLNNLPASWQHFKIAAKSFTVILQQNDAVDIAFKAERPLAIMTALSFVLAENHVVPTQTDKQKRTAHKYLKNMYDFQKLSGRCPQEQSYIGKVSDLVQYFPISCTIKDYVHNGYIRKLFKTPNETLNYALIFYDSIMYMTPSERKLLQSYYPDCLEQNVEKFDGIQPKESWHGIINGQLQIRLLETIDKFWIAELKEKQQHFKAACDIVLLMYSKDKSLRAKANSTSMCHFSPISNFMTMVWCPNMLLTEQEQAENHDALQEIWFALEGLLQNVCQHQYQDENICVVRNVSNLIVSHNCLVTIFLLLHQYLRENAPDLSGWKDHQMESNMFSFVIENMIVYIEHFPSKQPNRKTTTAHLGPYFNSLLRGSLGQLKKIIKITLKDFEDKTFMRAIRALEKELIKADHGFLCDLQLKGVDLYNQLWKESYLLKIVYTSKEKRDEIIKERIQQSSFDLVMSFKSQESGISSDCLLETIKESLYSIDLKEVASDSCSKVQDEPAIPYNSETKADASLPLTSSPEDNPSANDESEVIEELDPEYILSPEMVKELRDMAIEDMKS